MARRTSAGLVRARRAAPARPALELVPDLAFELAFGAGTRAERPARGRPGSAQGGERERATPPAPAL